MEWIKVSKIIVEYLGEEDNGEQDNYVNLSMEIVKRFNDELAIVIDGIPTPTRRNHSRTQSKSIRELIK